MRKKPFTLLELSAAMAVLMIFMLFVMRFYNASQDVMNRSAGKTDQFERARIIMDLLATDIQNMYYAENVDQIVYIQPADKGTGDDKYTEDLSFYVLRPQTSTATATDLAFVTYHFDKTNYTLKMGVAGDDQATKWGSALTGDDLGVLSEGVLNFRVIPLKANGNGINPAADRIPDYVRIELELMDGDDAEAIKNIKKVPGMTVPANLPDPNKTRSFSREVEIDRGQY